MTDRPESTVRNPAGAAEPIIGVLALQGDVREHLAALNALGATGHEVRRPDDLLGLNGLILPGGESTTLSMLIDSSGLRGPLTGIISPTARGTGMSAVSSARSVSSARFPVFGTCAGLVLLARSVLDGRLDQKGFAALDCRVRRNGYGRQVASFETDLDATGLERTLDRLRGSSHPVVNASRLPAIFIRAPVIEAIGPDVEVLVEFPRNGGPDPVVVRQGLVLAAAFHPELTTDRRLHELFVAMVRSAMAGSTSAVLSIAPPWEDSQDTPTRTPQSVDR